MVGAGRFIWEGEEYMEGKGDWWSKMEDRNQWCSKGSEYMKEGDGVGQAGWMVGTGRSILEGEGYMEEKETDEAKWKMGAVMW